MPGKDGAGPPNTAAQRGGRMGGARPGAGPSGECVCTRCGAKVPHKAGVPCNNLNCPECGAKMTRG